MSRILRILSTALVAAGVAFLYVYQHLSGFNRAKLLDEPSYYVLQNYWYVFLIGIAVLVVSLLGSFFSWFKVTEKQEVLPNAGYATEKDITTWMEGSSADTKTGPKTDTDRKAGETKESKNAGETMILPEEESNGKDE